MLNKGISNSAYIPLRKEASHDSEMISQLLFGEIFDIIEGKPSSWTRVRYNSKIRAENCPHSRERSEYLRLIKGATCLPQPVH